MASTVKHLRSSTASKRPTASGLTDGQLAINTASGTPGLFLKNSAGAVVKVGPAHVGASAPNAVPAGSAGNSTGELWVNNSTTINGLNYYTGSAFVNLTPSGTATVAGLVELATDAETQAGTDTIRAVTPSGLQSKLSDSIATTSSTTIASSTAVKSAYDLANAALPKAGGVITGALEIGTTGSLSFEGSSDDGFETTIAVVNPTADRTITFPNVTGTVVTTGDSGTVTSAMIANGTIVDADVNASAAIALSKLATGALPSGITIASSNLVDGTIVNADVNAAAGIVYGKLALSSGIVNTDISGSAAIALDKLATGALPTAITIASANIVNGSIVDADVNASAAIVDTKLATISTAGKVSNSATTATSANTASGIVARDGSGNFTAGTITAALTGAASSNVLKAGDTMTGVLAVTAGTAALPGLAVSGDPNTGIYSPGADQLAVATNGIQRLTVDTAATTSTLPIVHPLGAVGTPSITFTGDLNTGIWSPAADTVAASTAGTERLRITSSGLVGIGISAPNERLSVDVNGTTNRAVEIYNGDTVLNDGEVVHALRFTQNDVSAPNATHASIETVTTGALGLLNLVFKARNNTEYMRIDISGNVGIGTTNPLAPLHVENTAGGDLFYALGSNSDVFKISSDSSTINLDTRNATGGLAFQIQGTERARIDSSGRLLLGTSTALGLSSSTASDLEVETSGIAFSAIRNTNDAQGAILALGKSRGTTPGSLTAAVFNDILGEIRFAGADGATRSPFGGSIQCRIDGTLGQTAGTFTISQTYRILTTGTTDFTLIGAADSNPGTTFTATGVGTGTGTAINTAGDMPGRLVFNTTADNAGSPTERLRISSSGKIGLGTTAPAAIAHIGGNTIISNVDLANASYDSISFSVAGQESTPNGLFFSPDGRKMFITGATGDDVNEYTLSTPWDVSTASFVTVFSVSGQDTAPADIYFRADGRKMYMVGTITDAIYQYTLSTPWSIASASYDSISYSVATEELTPTGIFFKPDGLSVYIVGATSDAIYRYNLSTAWNISTASLANSFSVAGNETQPNTLTFTGDGSRLFVLGATGDDVNIYNLTTPWDISTASFVTVFSIAAQENAPQGIYLRPDGTKFYIVGQTNDTVYQYSIPSATIDLTGTANINGSAEIAQDLTVRGGVTISTNQLSVPLGTATAPSIDFDTDTNTGIFSPAADTFAVSTAGNERLRITSSGLVGVGTSAPDTLLTVSQSAPTDGILAKLVNPANASGSEAGIRLQHNNSTQLQCDLVTFRSGANAGVDFNIKLSDSSGTPQTRFTILEGGNVGIGTSAPVNLLHVQGDATFEANAGGQFTIRGSTNSQNRLNFGFHTTDNYAWIQAITAGTAFRPIALNPSGGSVGIGTGTTAPGGTLDIKAPSATAPLIVQGPSSEFARIDSSGRLLVGISTGLALVHIGNAVDNLFMDRNESVAGCPNASFRKSRGTAGAPTIVNADDLTGALQFRGYDGAAYITNALIRAEVDGTPGTNDMPGRLVFSTTADGASTPTERMRIGSTGVIAIGSTTTTGGGSGCSLRFANDLTGATTPVSILGTPQILADATATASVFMSQPGAAVTGATLGDVRHFIANSFSMGAGTTAANQIGFLATSSLTAATNNYGFRSNIAAGTGRWAFYADGTADSYFASSNFIFANGGTERARVDSSGRLLVGTSSALSTRLGFTALIAPVQVAGNTFNNNSSLLASYASGATGNSYLAFARSKSNVVGTDTAVIANDRLGAISFAGFDGTNQTEAVRIFAEVDGIPGADDMPGRLVFSTTADGAAAPTERLRITNDGVQAYDQPAPAAVNATATLTVANLKTGIITSTSAAATDMTLPTGTDTQAGFSGTYDNFTFEWSVINTGPSLVRVLAGTAHTIVGSGSVATGTSGRFASRRTAANTFVTYRLS